MICYCLPGAIGGKFLLTSAELQSESHMKILTSFFEHDDLFNSDKAFINNFVLTGAVRLISIRLLKNSLKLVKTEYSSNYVCIYSVCRFHKPDL